MKLRNLLITLGLTLTVGAGVRIALSTQHNDIKPVNATTSRALTGGDTLYCINYSNWSGTLYAHFWNTDTGTDITNWPGNQMTKVGTMAGHDLWSVTVPKKNSTNPNHVKFNNNSGSESNNLWTTATGKNMAYNNTGNDYVDSTVCKIIKKKLLGSTESDIGTEYISGTSWTVPSKQDYQANYVGNGWFKNDKTTSISGTYSGCDWETIVYSKYTSHGAWSGSITVDLGNSTWASAAANYAVLFMDKTTYPSEIDGWSSYLTGTSIGTYQISIPYSVSFEPKLMLIARYNSSYSQSSWNSNKWPGGESAWGQTDDIAFGTYVIVSDNNPDTSKNSASAYPPVIKGGTSTWTDRAILNDRKIDDTNGHVIYYATSVTFEKNERFKSVVPSSKGDIYYGAFTTHSSLTSNFSGDGSNDITVNVAGTYAFYFDSATASVYITSAAAEADDWAQYFLTNVGCDATGRTAPSGWSLCATEYGKLFDDAKDYVYNSTAKPSGTNVQKAVATYDYAVSHHSSLSRFIVDSGDTPRATANSSAILSRISINSSNATIIVVIVSMIGVASLAGYYFFRKSRKTEE